VSLDWRKLPAELLEYLPNRPKSADNYLKQKHKSTCKNYKQNLNNKTRLSTSELEQESKFPYTFNNCHFHYDHNEEKMHLISNGSDEHKVPIPRMPELSLAFDCNKSRKQMSLSEIHEPTITENNNIAHSTMWPQTLVTESKSSM
jgi:hypothetical protein